jgi:hypothetical protein
MIGEFHAAGTGPAGLEALTSALEAGFLVHIVLLVGMLACAFEVLGSVDRQVIEVGAFTSWLGAS